MTILSRKKKPTVDTEVDRLIEYLSKLDPESDSYLVVVTNLKHLKEACSLKTNDKPKGDVLVPVIANIVGLFSIMKFEKLDILSAKALGWLLKLKI